VSDPPKTLSSRFQTLSLLLPAPNPGKSRKSGRDGLPAPATPAAAEYDRITRPNGQNTQSRIVLLAPLPMERKPAIG